MINQKLLDNEVSCTVRYTDQKGARHFLQHQPVLCVTVSDRKLGILPIRSSTAFGVNEPSCCKYLIYQPCSSMDLDSRASKKWIQSLSCCSVAISVCWMHLPLQCKLGAYLRHSMHIGNTADISAPFWLCFLFWHKVLSLRLISQPKVQSKFYLTYSYLPYLDISILWSLMSLLKNGQVQI